MFALTYISQATHPFSESDLYALESQACDKNERLAVTGYLNYKKGKFLQYLEGEQNVVLDLMHTIEQDPRHTVLRVMHLPEIKERRFHDCSMRYWTYNELLEIRMDDMVENVLLKMSAKVYGEDILQQMVTRLVTRMAEMHRLHPPLPH
ncbi:Sensors of blue-light using FAD [Catalinimonas alkaloidigena]|uniref:Sensors of blue-light using FAD n=1 Tax=Catalinimonas alkaloidigena TaxID=1075417 RepID=A0A1G9R8G4_9BACT|nr:BLUF domain-containing protein [Catalinimonas alkaloidigena]SDM19421.1 Sensors of blue-light using FAD [Catalinimonas alkaloidigena]